MTDNDIIKALEYCLDYKDYHCENCPYRVNEKGVYCIRYLPQASLDLITRQKAEIETLKAHEEREHQLCKNVCAPKYEAEIERLNKKAEKIFVATINKVLSIEDHYVLVDDEFVQCEMMEDLENLFGMEFCEFNDDYEKNLDNLLKELAGAENDR